MTRSRNLLPLAGFAVSVVAFVSYPTFFVQFPATRDLAWANWLLFALGLALVGIGVGRAFRRPERYRGRVFGPILAAASLGVLGFFVFMTEIASRDLPAAANAPNVGEKAPDFALSDANGRTVSLSDVIDPKWALLIFYRGHW